MNAERLLAHYERIADAPDAIPRLRRFILDLAVRGKLVPQDSNNEPASQLLKRIAIEKARLDRRERAKEPRKSQTASAAAKVEVPSGWALAKLSELVAVINGRAYSKNELLDAGTPVLRVGNLFTSDKWYYSDLHLDEDKYCNNGDLIFAWSASFGPFIWNGGRVIYHYHIWKLQLYSEAYLNKFYLYNFLLQKTREIKEAGHGVGMIHMTKEKMEQIEVSIPPLAEQHRIVAKVDELMVLCDRLETTRAKWEATRDQLTAASLARLNEPDPDTFRDDARFALDALPALAARADQVKQLRQTILNLAVRGKLVEQDVADEPASELVRRMPNSAGRKAKQNDRERPEEEEADKPFVCPSGWTWTTVQHTLDGDREISYGVIKLGDEPKSGGVPTLRCSDVRPGFIDLSGVRRVQENIEAEYARTRLSGGEVVINIRGTLGGVALVPNALAGFNVAREVAVVPIASELFGRFIVYLMLSSYFWTEIQGNLRGIAYKGLNLGILRNILIPLPPLAEQRRIVAKVDELMALCARLEASLTTTDDTRRRLLDALLAEALMPEDAFDREAAE
jgi:type I restriction enzyme S subunit